MTTISSIINEYAQQAADYEIVSYELEIIQLKYNSLVQVHNGCVDIKINTDQDEIMTDVQTDLIDLRVLYKSLEEQNRRMQIEYDNNVNTLSKLKIDFDIISNEYEACRNNSDKTIENIQQVINHIINLFQLGDLTDVVDVMSAVESKIKELHTTINDNEMELNRLRRLNATLEGDTADQEKHLFNLIKDVDNNLTSQLENIDTEIALYGTIDDVVDIDRINISNYLRIDTLELNNIYDKDYLPFLRLISEKLGNDDFDDDTKIDNAKYYSYIFLIQQILSVYSLNYIRGYLECIYKECQKVLQTSDKIIQIPALTLPQTLQTNSLYFLQNRYNTKAYDPDHVVDFGDFLFNFVKPEFQPNTTLALNLFQPNIGRRYNSILIYTDDTMKKLQQLRDKLSNIL